MPNEMFNTASGMADLLLARKNPYEQMAQYPAQMMARGDVAAPIWAAMAGFRGGQASSFERQRGEAINAFSQSIETDEAMKGIKDAWGVAIQAQKETGNIDVANRVFQQLTQTNPYAKKLLSQNNVVLGFAGTNVDVARPDEKGNLQHIGKATLGADNELYMNGKNIRDLGLSPVTETGLKLSGQAIESARNEALAEQLGENQGTPYNLYMADPGNPYNTMQAITVGNKEAAKGNVIPSLVKKAAKEGKALYTQTKDGLLVPYEGQDVMPPVMNQETKEEGGGLWSWLKTKWGGSEPETYETPEAVKAAYQSGKITKDEARKRLSAMGINNARRN